MMTNEEIVIDENNFNQYFFDVRTHKPKKGQIMACYSAMAELVCSNEKKQMMDLLRMHDKAYAATQVMRKLLFASELDAIKVPKQILEDLKSGMSDDEVLDKPYKYKMEMFFYTEPQYLPADPHWSSISLLNL
ncbi:MAG: hypothetical protein DWQ19_10775 [Crenarchaeota archaeon]|nr:MAG: hypothetical protein DWQ19_10775 [Thermoproteota archaeon]